MPAPTHEQILTNMLNLVKQQPAELIAIVGPTASGKTDLTLALAEKLGLEIINADSRVIYQEMNIGTAKPSAEELARVKHHLVDIKSPFERYSAAEYQRDFDQVMIYRSIANMSEAQKHDVSHVSAIPREAKNPHAATKPRAIVVGGTGLYLRAALEDLDLPGIASDPELRAQIKSKFETQGLNALVNELLEMDPQASGLVDLQNHVRVMRALESVILSGKSLAQLRRKLDKHRYDVLYLGLNYSDRSSLYAGIDSRVHKMIEVGLVEEVHDLLTKYGATETLNSTIGYAEIIEHLNGDINLDQAIAKIQQATRNYAKRQITWFNSNKRINWLYR